MRTSSIAIIVAGLAALSGCATAPADPALIAAANRTITCTAGADCDAKWSRAVGWIVQNSRWKIQTQTEQLIQTYGPGADGSTDLAYTVSKVATGGTTYTIQLGVGCANMFGCIPDALTQRASFNTFVSPPNTSAGGAIT